MLDEQAESLLAETSLEESADIQEKFKYVLLPSIDAKGMLIWRMTIKDGFQIMRESHEAENMARAGLSESAD
ncbi:hypothetical protein [Neptunomonas japonica]|uniref:hypothetical protein n=1 Tax=Neptunomonas japonica TaxID=417574 RepID=UPI0004119D44|nr:hypothetical protein [Neptunomonas japonica]